MQKHPNKQHRWLRISHHYGGARIQIQGVLSLGYGESVRTNLCTTYQTALDAQKATKHQQGRYLLVTCVTKGFLLYLHQNLTIFLGCYQTKTLHTDQ